MNRKANHIKDRTSQSYNSALCGSEIATAGLFKLIPLTQGKFAIVDTDNYKWLSKYKWCARKGRNTWYAARGTEINGRKRTIRMHREILDVPKDRLTDHKNGNGLDNREYNLRICTAAENQWNQRKKYKGIYWSISSHKWVARIRHNGKRIQLGMFITKTEATAAYKKAIKELRGSFV